MTAKTSSPVEFTENNFSQEVLNSETPVLVDFWASWCGPCRALGPTMDELSQDVDGVAKVGKLNVDEHPRVAEQYGVHSIPTLLFFQNGELKGRLVGVHEKAVLRQHLDDLGNPNDQ